MSESSVEILYCDTQSILISGSGFSEVLSPEELSRAKRFRDAALSNRYKLGRYFLRKVLAERAGCKAGDLRLLLGDQGKPYLPGGPAFNMSDSKSLVVIGLANDGNLGVDIEHIVAHPDLEQIAQRYFSQDECTAMNGMSAEDKTRGFYRAWTRKEALVKAIGGGLTIPLDAFSVSLDEADGNMLLRGGGEIDPNSWFVQSVSIDASCEAAIAWDRRPSIIQIHEAVA